MSLENDERGGNVHSHIVRVNEDYNDESLRGFQEDDSVEEEIVAVNEGNAMKDALRDEKLFRCFITSHV